MSKDLTPEKARIFRITHAANLRWILANGMHCANSATSDPNFVPIGNAELIGKRRTRALPPPHQGVLSDYVPFYFTPYSPMMYNIHTGWGGIQRQENEDVIILVSSLGKLREASAEFVFSDRHAYLSAAQFYRHERNLGAIDWDILQRRDFRRDPENPEKVERYQAEALVIQHVPVNALLGVACYNSQAKKRIDGDVAKTGVQIRTVIQAAWYF
jgi:hypothetical protein